LKKFEHATHLAGKVIYDKIQRSEEFESDFAKLIKVEQQKQLDILYDEEQIDEKMLKFARNKYDLMDHHEEFIALVEEAKENFTKKP
jgi:hypothetical protein